MKTPEQLSSQALGEFKAMYAEEFGKSLSDAEIHKIATELLSFFGVLTAPEHDVEPNHHPRHRRKN